AQGADDAADGRLVPPRQLGGGRAVAGADAADQLGERDGARHARRLGPEGISLLQCLPVSHRRHPRFYPASITASSELSRSADEADSAFLLFLFRERQRAGEPIPLAGAPGWSRIHFPRAN